MNCNCPITLNLAEQGCGFNLMCDGDGDGVTIKIPYRVDVLLHRPASRFIYSYWVG